MSKYVITCVVKGQAERMPMPAGVVRGAAFLQKVKNIRMMGRDVVVWPYEKLT